MKSLSVQQTAIAVVALCGVTVLGLADVIGSEAIIAIYSGVIGGALGYVNGKKASGGE